MTKFAFLPVASCLTLAACNAAAASSPNSNDDLDCAVLSYYYMEAAKAGGTEAQQHATLVMHQWYSAKMQERAQQSGKSMEEVLAPGASLLSAVQRDPKSMANASLACARRAAADPHFEGFASSL